MDYLVWTVSVLLIVIGLAGVVVPLLPGTTLILIGMVWHKLLLPADLSWLSIGIIAVIWFLSVLADFAGVIIGTRLGGGSKWGMAGAGAGSFVGMWFSIPLLVLGTVLGAIVAEKFLAKKTDREAFRAGVGAAAGFVLSTVARLFCAVGMIVAFAIAVYASPAS